MEKKFISFSKKENVIFKFGEDDVEIIPYLDTVAQTMLINDYIEQYFNPDQPSIKGTNRDYFGAEYGLRLIIIDRFTNISIKKEDGSDIDVITLLASGVWEAIENKIENYNEFRKNLFFILESIEDEITISKSLGSVVDSFANKIGGYLETLSQLSTEDIKEVGEQATKLLKDIEESPASELFREASKETKGK